ncbi:hypothetical protein BTHERMOSOX_693 [Bathymodiolus thermophilus thioautotrophic gill symbiont]|uniref:Uncharacterized protein n=1 Tax=Bathymodiolus thermophilus thioautotrophic gill symbiont TaxID=2360 RepID=A0A3G3IJR7_9GAMM|nr:hypothetical protein [Bathymodiolus thermophilus thioautotrophic gill symbiont]AYQ56100.1 hypothetical protein MS2017_0354 [Bathymodiolus thermophilus thioautotrophic gill symbiont]CAB5494658.1 hypothetical protein THERMOT_148 [Bathymodiolus thermophilus thioautotrophic gill symbiont]CAB5502029.1 hypothetical protein THERMOS_1509 [Bathymodiolus thermophilus thioautotrophic gill symbiont]SHA00281.1 hypothetical protein BTHERMOSOX_693 [Bathymodiolus thermophilus thioautotrophic gill symbiont]
MKTTIGLDEMKNVRGGVAPIVLGILLVVSWSFAIAFIVAWLTTFNKAGVSIS